MRGLRVWDIVRVVSRNRRQAPSHGDIGKVVAKTDPLVQIRILKLAEGSTSSLGEAYTVNTNEVVIVDVPTQISILQEAQNESRVLIDEENAKIRDLQGRVEWLQNYGSEENAIATVVYELAKNSGSKEEAQQKIAAAIKGKFNFI